MTTPPQQPAQRARRPTTLAYCERTVPLPRLRRTKPPDVSRPADQPKAAVITVAADVVAAPTTTMRVVAPTATPEDSFVEDGSSSYGAELDTLPLDETGVDETATATALSTAVASSDAQRPHGDFVSDDRRTLETSCLDLQSIPEVARLSMTSLTDAATQRPTRQRRAAMRRIHLAISGARQRFRQLAHRTVADEQPTATAAFSEQRASSPASVVDDAVSAPTSSPSLVAIAGRSTVVAPMASADMDACSSAGSSTVALSDSAGSDTETLAADVSMILGGRRISPASPSYDEKHARFSHVGAHALDVFCSPEDLDDDDYETSDRSDSARADTSSSSLWRPLASCSGTLQQQSSMTSASLHVSTRSVAFTDHPTSGLRLPSVPEASRRSFVADDGSVSVQGLSDDVVKSMSSVLAVLSPTEATRSSTLASSGNDSTAAADRVECDGSRVDVSDYRFVVIFIIT